MIKIADIISMITTYLSSMLSVTFIGTALIAGVIAGIVVRLLGSRNIFDGFKAGAIYYLVNPILLGIILSLIGGASPWIVLAITYGLLIALIGYFSRIGLLKSVIAAVAISWLNSQVISLVFSF